MDWKLNSYLLNMNITLFLTLIFVIQIAAVMAFSKIAQKSQEEDNNRDR